eukprot:6457736-Amphidinium_carterae.2
MSRSVFYRKTAVKRMEPTATCFDGILVIRHVSRDNTDEHAQDTFRPDTVQIRSGSAMNARRLGKDNCTSTETGENAATVLRRS